MDEPTTITAHFKLQPTRCVLINAVKHGTWGIQILSLIERKIVVDQLM